MVSFATPGVKGTAVEQMGDILAAVAPVEFPVHRHAEPFGKTAGGQVVRPDLGCDFGQAEDF